MKKIALFFCILTIVLGCSYHPFPKRVKLSKECKSYFRFLQKVLKQDRKKGYYIINNKNINLLFEKTQNNCKCFVGLKSREIRDIIGTPTGVEDKREFGYNIHALLVNQSPAKYRSKRVMGIMVAKYLDTIRKAQLSRWDSTLRLY